MALKGFSDLYTGNSELNRYRFLVERSISEMWTSFPVQVVGVTAAGTDPVGYLNVVPMVNQEDGFGEIVNTDIIFNVPYLRIQGGANAVIIDPQEGDRGLAMACMRDITTVKETRQISPPSTRRKYDPSDIIYLGGILNDLPVRYLRITDNGVEIQGVSNVTINGDNTTINATTATVNAATQINMRAPLTIVEGNMFVSGGFGWSGTNYFPEGATRRLRINVPLDSTSTIDADGEITGNGIPLSSHVHTYSGSSGTTNPPRR